jgi:hypothetical protein
MSKSSPHPLNLSPAIGLCAMCRHVNLVKTAKGSMFILCEQAKVDDKLSKYPVLPVLMCRGFDPHPREE